MTLRAFACTVAVTTTIALGAAHGQQPQARNPAAAEKIFNEAVEAEDKGDWEKACSLYAASFKLDPSVGTQLNLGRCAEHFGKIATAWGEFQKARTLNRDTPTEQRKAEVDKFLADADARLKSRVPYITVEVRNKPPGLRVANDGADLPVETLGIAIPIDPGRHTLVFTAPDFKQETRQVELAEGAKQTITVELVSAPKVVPPDKADPAGGAHPQLIAGIALGVAGGLALIGSAVTGGLTLDRRSQLDDLEAPSGSCVETDGTLHCAGEDTAAAEALSSEGSTLGVTTTVLMVSGAALAATGVIVALTAPKQAAPKATTIGWVPWLSANVAGASVLGRFD